MFLNSAVRLNGDSPEPVALQEQLGEVNDTSEKEIIDDLLGDIAKLGCVGPENILLK